MSLHNELVSAVITTHNRKDLLIGAIKSVQSQTYKNIECIVVDDASTDGTDELCESLTGIEYIRIKPEDSRGGNYARNLGIQNARGEYIAFLDDDDEWFPKKIEKQIVLFDNNPKLGMVYCELYADVGNKRLNYKVAFDRRGNLYEQKNYWKPICTTSAMLFRKSVFDLIGGFDENVRYWQEYELTLRLIKTFEVDFVSEPLVRYRREINDKKKLTNNFYNWQDSVKYIEEKHKLLFDNLDSNGMKKYLEVYYSEGAYRASAVGNRKAMTEFYKKAYYLSHRKEYLIRWKMNVSRQDTRYIEPIIKKCLYVFMNFKRR